MNKRIQQLAEHATTEHTSYYDGRGNVTETYFDKEKFAELIVQECASIDFRREVGLTADDDYEVGKVIKEHFGVTQ